MRGLRSGACQGVCSVVEGPRGVNIYPYRCSRCGRCFVCHHWQIGYRWWVCKWPLGLMSTRPSPGILAL